MKKLCILAVLALIAAPAVAQNLVVNGAFDNGETGWTQWSAAWGGGQSWSIFTTDGQPAPSARARLTSGAGSFGWYQRIVGLPGVTYTLDADWFGNIGAGSWAEVMFFRILPTTTEAEIVTRIDTGAAADIAFKKDAWGQNNVDPWSWAWQPADLSPATNGNAGSVLTNVNRYHLVVALKYGHTDSMGPITGNVRWDNIIVTGPMVIPEPAGVLAMLTGVLSTAGFVIRRRK